MKFLLSLLLLLPTMGYAYRTIEFKASNTINFNQAFTSQYVAKKQLEATLKCYKNIGSTINIALYTPGGSISAGQRFYDTLNGLPCKFNTLTIFAASMGYQTVQQLGKRLILPSGTLMSHRASVRGLGGEIYGELDVILDAIKASVDELDIDAANRAGITLKEYRNLIKDELWMTGKQAVKMKHADELVFARCNKDLLGTSFEKVVTFFGSFNVEFSNCPLIIGPISVTASEKFNEIKEYYNDIGLRVYWEL